MSTIIQVDKKDVMQAACQLTSIICKEQVESNNVVLNLSGSLWTFSIASYISGCMTQSRAITVIPKYNDNDEEMGLSQSLIFPSCRSHRSEKSMLILLGLFDMVCHRWTSLFFG
jgi:CRISPR-associated protein Csa3